MYNTVSFKPTYSSIKIAVFSHNFLSSPFNKYNDQILLCINIILQDTEQFDQSIFVPVVFLIIPLNSLYCL